MEEYDILRKIEAIVCAGEEVKPEWMRRTPRGRNYLTEPKQIIMFLARELYSLPYACIGGYYRRNHETAMSSYNIVKNRCDTNRAFKAKIESYIQKVAADMPGLLDLEVIQLLQQGIKSDLEDIKKRQYDIDELIKKLIPNIAI